MVERFYRYGQHIVRADCGTEGAERVWVEVIASPNYAPGKLLRVSTKFLRPYLARTMLEADRRKSSAVVMQAFDLFLSRIEQWLSLGTPQYFRRAYALYIDLSACGLLFPEEWEQVLELYLTRGKLKSLINGVGEK